MELTGKLIIWRPNPWTSIIGLDEDDGIPSFIGLDTLFGKFNNKKVKITIEEI